MNTGSLHLHAMLYWSNIIMHLAYLHILYSLYTLNTVYYNDAIMYKLVIHSHIKIISYSYVAIITITIEKLRAQ